jgi:heme-degrading monooxygenase HmoA
MYVMLTQKLSKGFKSWKAMAEANAEKIKGFNGKILYAGSHAEDDNSMVVIMHYESKEGLMAFKNDEELTKARQEAGVGFDAGIKVCGACREGSDSRKTIAVTFYSCQRRKLRTSGLKNPLTSMIRFLLGEMDGKTARSRGCLARG